MMKVNAVSEFQNGEAEWKRYFTRVHKQFVIEKLTLPHAVEELSTDLRADI
ncbi:hypothetical protein CANCADRAFT_31905, partial [Tortispora caseinolytica NRRL Y-17796]